MLNALCDRLLEKPGMYQDEMALFLGTISMSKSQLPAFVHTMFPMQEPMLRKQSRLMAILHTPIVLMH